MLAISVRRPLIPLPLTKSKSHLGALRSTKWSQDMSKASRIGLSGMSAPIYLNHASDILTRSLHWSFRTHRYFGTKGMEVKRHRVVELQPLETAVESPPSLTTFNPVIRFTPKFSLGEKGALVLIAWLSALSPLIPTSIALRVYVYSAFITMTVFILSIIFDLHSSFNSFSIARF